MSDRAALLAAVLANPDDDTPRLVYADYLDETGDPADAARAEFIRLEVEADRLTPGGLKKQQLEARAAVLLRHHLRTWNARELPGWVKGGSRVFYRRGFPFELECGYERFAVSAANLFAVAPVEAVALSAGQSHSAFRWADVADRPRFLDRVRTLTLSPFIGPDVSDLLTHDHGPPLAGLCEAGGFTGLWVLDVTTAVVRDPVLFAFLRRFPKSAFADTLDELLLADNRVTDAGAAALAAAPGLDRLRVLDVRKNLIGPAGLGPLRARFGDRLLV